MPPVPSAQQLENNSSIDVGGSQAESIGSESQEPPTTNPDAPVDEFSNAPSFGQAYKGNESNTTKDKGSAKQLGESLLVLLVTLLLS